MARNIIIETSAEILDTITSATRTGDLQWDYSGRSMDNRPQWVAKSTEGITEADGYVQYLFHGKMPKSATEFDLSVVVYGHEDGNPKLTPIFRWLITEDQGAVVTDLLKTLNKFVTSSVVPRNVEYIKTHIDALRAHIGMPDYTPDI